MQIDSQGVYFLLHSHNAMLSDALQSRIPIIPYRNVQRVIICGMGGSGVVGEYAAAFSPDVLITVVKAYSLPTWVSSEDLVICISYSGNTEEILSCFSQALKKNALCVVVSSGGKLINLARDAGVSIARVPSSLPPRFATVHMLVPVLQILKQLGITSAIDAVPSSVHVDEGFISSFAKQLVGKTPLFYASTKNTVLAEKCKTDVNENAKFPAFYNVFSEANHNELCSYEHITPNYVVVFLRDASDHPQIIKRMDVIKATLQKQRILVLDLPLPSTNRPYAILYGNLLSLLLSYFLAIEYGIDPGPVHGIEEFKLQLSK